MILSPDKFIEKFQSKFLPALSTKLAELNKGRILRVSNGPAGIDILLEDNKGDTELYSVDPFANSWIKVM